MHAATFRVVNVASRGGSASAGRTEAQRAVDLDEVIFRVVEIVVRTVVEEITGSVVGMAVHAIVVGGGVAREAGGESVRTVLLPGGWGTRFSESSCLTRRHEERIPLS